MGLVDCLNVYLHAPECACWRLHVPEWMYCDSPIFWGVFPITGMTPHSFCLTVQGPITHIGPHPIWPTNHDNENTGCCALLPAATTTLLLCSAAHCTGLLLLSCLLQNTCKETEYPKMNACTCFSASWNLQILCFNLLWPDWFRMKLYEAAWGCIKLYTASVMGVSCTKLYLAKIGWIQLLHGL